jgi:hypothetical protein
MGGSRVLCLFGDAVNVAGRLEQVPPSPHAARAPGRRAPRTRLRAPHTRARRRA